MPEASRARVVAFDQRPTDDAPASVEAERIAEALVFASAEPVPEQAIAEKLPAGTDARAVMERLAAFYGGRGVNLRRVGDRWALRTAPDLAWLIRREQTRIRKPSRPALETLAIVAYHQPVTRAEIEEIRGVATSAGVLDTLMEAGWVRMRGRRRAPGRPITYGTTPAFLDHFSLQCLTDLPGAGELKGAGLLSPQVPADFEPPAALVDGDLGQDEEPLDAQEIEGPGLLAPEDGAEA